MSLEAARERPARSAGWPGVTMLVMILGYSGYYLCRSNFSVARPLILAEYPGLDKVALGGIESVGTFVYAVGKIAWGGTANAVGGRRMFLIGMGGSVLFTLLFGFGGPPVFLLAWMGNRAVQSAGWPSVVQVTSRWFSQSAYGRVLGIVSLSYLFGDFLSRLFLGAVIDAGSGWRGMFWISAAGLALLLVPTAALLRDSPRDRGLEEPPGHAGTLADPDREGWRARLLPLLKSPPVWVLCAVSFGFTLIRETFNEWMPTYLHESAGMGARPAALASALFPLFGGFGVLAAGFLSDRLRTRGRSVLVVSGLTLATAGLLALAFGAGLAAWVQVGLSAAVGFALIGPCSMLAGAMSLDLGGRSGGAAAASWVDGFGYFGAILSGYGVAELAQRMGWQGAFLVLAAVAAASAALAAVYWRHERAQ